MSVVSRTSRWAWTGPIGGSLRQALVLAPKDDPLVHALTALTRTRRSEPESMPHMDHAAFTASARSAASSERVAHQAHCTTLVVHEPQPESSA